MSSVEKMLYSNALKNISTWKLSNGFLVTSVGVSTIIHQRFTKIFGKYRCTKFTAITSSLIIRINIFFSFRLYRIGRYSWDLPHFWTNLHIYIYLYVDQSARQICECPDVKFNPCHKSVLFHVYSKNNFILAICYWFLMLREFYIQIYTKGTPLLVDQTI